MTDGIDQQQQRRAEALKTFRLRYRRIDYYPTSKALEAIERVRAEHPAFNTREVLDRLVIEGERYFRKSAT